MVDFIYLNFRNYSQFVIQVFFSLYQKCGSTVPGLNDIKILETQLPAHTFKNLPFWSFYYTPMCMQINIVAHSRDHNMHILIRFFRYPFILARVPIIQIVFYELGVFFVVGRFDFAAGYDYLFYVVGYLIFASTQLDKFSELIVFIYMYFC